MLQKVIDLLVEQNSKLDRISALLVSQQLLTECVDYQGQPREAETCAEIVTESYSAGLCLVGDLEQRNRDYRYQQDEFFIEDEEDDEDDDNYEEVPA